MPYCAFACFLCLSPSSVKHVEDCVTYWYNAKERRLGQRKRKAYSKRQSSLKKRKTFDIRELSSESSDESSESDSVSSKTDHKLW